MTTRESMAHSLPVRTYVLGVSTAALFGMMVGLLHMNAVVAVVCGIGAVLQVVIFWWILKSDRIPHFDPGDEVEVYDPWMMYQQGPTKGIIVDVPNIVRMAEVRVGSKTVKLPLNKLRKVKRHGTDFGSV